MQQNVKKMNILKLNQCNLDKYMKNGEGGGPGIPTMQFTSIHNKYRIIH